MTKQKPTDEMRFEEAFEELTGLVAKLEAGDLELEESLALFERGQALAERCSQLLEEAELTLASLRRLRPKNPSNPAAYHSWQRSRLRCSSYQRGQPVNCTANYHST